MGKEPVAERVSHFLVQGIYGRHKLESSCWDKACLGENRGLLPTAFLLPGKKRGTKGKDHGVLMFIHLGSSCRYHNNYKNDYNNAALISYSASQFISMAHLIGGW